ncbi:unnamed protein product [Orchesella dallaii]|uniref:Ero1-like protein n=1 Tax=Orchesella dallaii TaxID=48710 RepID=A0ABP1Q0F6_9HEXA
MEYKPKTLLKYWALFLFLCGLPLQSSSNNFLNQLKTKDVIKIKTEESCFCQLQGTIDDCTCQIDTETVDQFNNYKVYPRLSSLLSKDYFRYFQVNLKRPCPFWDDDGSCSFEFCQVKTCREEDVPAGLKGQRAKIKPFTAKDYSYGGNEDCADEDLGSINLTLSEETQAGFERWKVYDQSLVDFCTVKDEIDSDMQYVDLLLNPERYTGYKGPSAIRVWDAIYKENCFRSLGASNSLGPFGTDSSEEVCIEKRTFYRAISGLHASINTHLSSKYLLSDSSGSLFKKGKPEPEWGLNVTEFLNHFEKPEARKTGFPWLKNLYFLYLMELRAIWKASTFLRNFDLYTGNSEDDADLKDAVKDLLTVVGNFPSHFDEKALFSTKDSMKLRSEFHERFTNITRIMDCVGCQKCKLWGKLQVKGLGTALKILFSEPPNFTRGQQEFLSRNEIVALFNAFGRLSESIHQLENFRRMIGPGGKGG